MSWLSNNKFLSGIILLISLSYPFLVYFTELPTSAIALSLVTLSIIKQPVTLTFAPFILFLYWLDERMYPVMMSLSFAFLTGWTLFYPPSLIERYARMVEPDLDAHGVKYTYYVTVIWLAFSVLNAGISFGTVLINDQDIWFLYNGVISYIMIGLIFVGEYAFRQYYRNKKSQLIPAHRLLSVKDHQYWETFWKSNEFVSYPHYVWALAKKIRESDAKRVFVISEDRAYFLAGLFAALYANKPVVLPQSDTPDLLSALMQTGDVLLTDQPKQGIVPMNIAYDATIPIKFPELDPEKATVIFYTSGSTGKPKPVVKKLSQLEAEVNVLHHLWGEGQQRQGRFFSTVSHHHLYAFLYSLLWPVCGGFQLERRTFIYWGDLMGKCGPDDFLISSPSHLGRFSILGECTPITLRHVFSSGAPLSYEAAVESKKHLGVFPIEVYGSTETGGIAFRQQEKPLTPWKRFECVDIASGKDEKLYVKSPYIDGSYQTEDLIKLLDADTFHLLGRADRIVKVEGKRASLTEIEDKLLQNELVAEAAVLALDKSYRDELGAVIVLSSKGKVTLDNVGKMALTRKLRELLSLYFHSAVVPRKWRFVDAIPVNSQGKRSQSALKATFKNNAKLSLGPVRHPIIVKKDFLENHVEYSLKIPKDLAYFSGHFKEFPIVPGVVQFHWVVELAKADFCLQGDVSQGNQIKFSNPMRPDDEVSLSVEYNKDKSSVAYSYKKGATHYSSGRIVFGLGASDGI